MDRAEILNTASEYVTKDRDEAYGTPENNFRKIAGFWNEYLSDRLECGITSEDVAIMMCLLKIARIASGQTKDDNYIDLAGYAACAGELATE